MSEQQACAVSSPADLQLGSTAAAAAAAPAVSVNSKEVIAASRFSQQLIEQKERELHESIAINYTRIRDVEKELRELQMQVKLTAEPKKQALELLRRKIEAQNITTQAVRRRYDVAKQAYEQLQAELEHEEGIKQQLCDELNQLVSTSVSCQLESFEQLKVKLEALHAGTAAAGHMGRASSAPAAQVAPSAAVGAAAAKVAAAAAGADATTTQQRLQQQAYQQQPQLPVSTAAADDNAAQAQAEAAAARAAAAAEAEAARARHVQLPGRSRHKAGASASAAGAGLPAAAAAVAAGALRQHPISSSSSSTYASEQRGRSTTATERDGRFAGFDA